MNKFLKSCLNKVEAFTFGRCWRQHSWQLDSKLNLRSIYNVLVFHEYLFTGAKLSSSNSTTAVILVRESCLNFSLHCK